MNPDMKITVYETPVAPETENLFDDAFWDNLDGVCNALDNIKAREYSDSMSFFSSLICSLLVSFLFFQL